MSDPTPDTEILLSVDQARVVVSPWGAALRRYFFVDPDRGETDIIWGYSGGRQKKGGQGDVLMPFPGRVAEGRYEFDGQILQLERNDKEGPNAIHGFVRTMPWKTSRADSHSAQFEVRLDAQTFGPRGYPFSLDLQVTYRLTREALDCAFAVHNLGNRPAPVGVGFHPYFTASSPPIDDVELRIPAAGFLEFNDRLAPTGVIHAVDGTEWDYRAYRRIGERQFNHCYVQLERTAEGMATASLRHEGSGRVIEIAMDRSFEAIVVYTGDAIPGASRRAVAVEPMTCATDAFNHPEWGLKRLGPGETFSGRYSVIPRGGR